MNKDEFNKYALEKQNSHTYSLIKTIWENIDMDILNYHKLGSAYIIASILNNINNHDFTIENVKESLNSTMNKDEKLKEYVHEVMKDLK